MHHAELKGGAKSVHPLKGGEGAQKLYYYTPVLERTTNTESVLGVQYLCDPCPL